MEGEEGQEGEVREVKVEVSEIKEEGHNHNGEDGCLIEDGLSSIKANFISQGKTNNPDKNTFFLQ